MQRAAAAGLRPPANLGLIAGTDAVSDVFKLLTIGTAVAAAISLLLPKQSIKQQLANEHVRVPVMLTSESAADGARPRPPGAPPPTAIHRGISAGNTASLGMLAMRVKGDNAK